MSYKSRVGELRPSQILYSFGVGAVVDLPNISVIVMGLDDWETQYATPIGEERLLLAVRKELGPQITYLRQAPIPTVTESIPNPFDEMARVGIPVNPFPTWVLCPACKLLAPLKAGAFTLKKDLYRPEKTRYEHTLCNRKKPPTVVPVRFLAACSNGHLDDFPWHYFVHKGNSGCRGEFRLQEVGVSGTAADVRIKCQICESSRSMSEAFGEVGKKNMPRCRGRHPHLRKIDDEGCEEQMKSILLGASNSWFPVALSAFSIPKTSNKLAQLIDKNWLVLQGAVNLDVFKAIYQAFRVTGQLAELYNYSDEEIWEQIEKKRNGENIDEDLSSDLKTPEWEVFIAADKNRNTTDFELSPVLAPKGYERFFEKIVLVEKLREVTALIGFTRIESPYDYQELSEMPEWSPLSRTKPKWVPASEMRGEGIFIQFSEEAISEWEKNNKSLIEYEKKNNELNAIWRQSRNLPPTVPHPGTRYVLIHSFSHALMRQLSIECGYNAASLKERIYSKTPEQDNGPMAGVLIYTAAPDSEGTLGGLVSLGTPDKLAYHIQQALEKMGLCASDPLCAEHNPLQGNISLHWAACHACLFSAETSCERGNKYLDRSLLIPTVKTIDLAFFTFYQQSNLENSTSDINEVNIITEKSEVDNIVSNDDLEIIDDADSSLTPTNNREKPVAFYDDCIKAFEKLHNTRLIKKSRSTYITEDKKIAVMCVVSKIHKGSTHLACWFAFHPYQKEFLEQYETSFLLLGCGSKEQILLIPYLEVKTWLDDVWITEREGKMYWHLRFHLINENIYLSRKKDQGQLDVTHFLITNN